MRLVVLAVTILLGASIYADDICPDQKTKCGGISTCCSSLPEGTYACCPFPEAVCCSDQIHCCPGHTVCNLQNSTCNHKETGESLYGWNEKRDGIDIDDTPLKNECPDKKHQCPGFGTCCEKTDGSYGCCPYAEAKCCSDKIHCCPPHTVCDLKDGTCNHKASDQFVASVTKHEKAEKKEPKEHLKLDDANVQCEGGQSSCPTGSTCCQLASGSFGCCPTPNAVCCSDHVHCCPDETRCDLEKQKCIHTVTGVELDWHHKDVSKTVAKKPEYTVCEDKKHLCPGNHTCCQMESGEMGCCPIDKGTCCGDHVHCCPKDTTCNVDLQRCEHESGQHQVWVSKVPANKKSQPKSTPKEFCPDGVSSCPGGSTCCRKEGGYACCPYRKATCCSDHLHCCPESTACDTTRSRCVHQNGDITSWSEKHQPEKKELPTGQKACAGGGATCPSGTTCCQLKSGQWGCCPYENAICCADHIHCCPSGSHCDVSHSQCVKEDGQTVEWSSKIDADASSSSESSEEADSEPEGSRETCPDHFSTCDSGSCCKMANGHWGCCPWKNGICCPDHEHCCPEDTKCDTTTKNCLYRNGTTMQWHVKHGAHKINTESVQNDAAKELQCPDGRGCPQGTTCCQLSGGSFGCCPYKNAICCSDSIHCCPENHMCNLKDGQCVSEITGKAVDWLEKGPARQGSPTTLPTLLSNLPIMRPEDHIPNDILFPNRDDGVVMCQDGKSECPNGFTCCMFQSDQYGCCPLVNAVCCSDDIHCCPSGQKCDVTTGRCTKNGAESVFLTMIRSHKPPHVSVHNSDHISCPNQRQTCPRGQKCCPKMGSVDEYACCADANGECCTDSNSCCDAGWKCLNNGNGECEKHTYDWTK